MAELLDASEPLIHNTYGYGSQGLINLMLTGRAVAHVWDDDQDIGGLSKLKYINVIILYITRSMRQIPVVGLASTALRYRM